MLAARAQPPPGKALAQSAANQGPGAAAQQERRRQHQDANCDFVHLAYLSSEEYNASPRCAMSRLTK